MIGLSADLVNLAMKYDLMRLFDGKKVSCGPKRRKIREYIEHVTALYLNAGIYSKNNSNTFTAIVINQLSETKVFLAGKHFALSDGTAILMTKCRLLPHERCAGFRQQWHSKLSCLR